MKEKKPPLFSKKPSKTKSLDIEDVTIWEQATCDVTALHPTNKVNPLKPYQNKRPVRVQTHGRITLETLTIPITNTHSSSFQMDKALKKRFEAGDLPLDGQIDLHGLTLAEAHRQFIQFITRMIATESRFILVITGKGSTESQNGRGIIRKNLPLWCNDAHLKPHILQVTTAKPKHGGSGASYILLRKR